MCTLSVVRIRSISNGKSGTRSQVKSVRWLIVCAGKDRWVAVEG